MPHETPTEIVRELITQAFAELGASGQEIRETILIKGGNYCGRRFEAAGAVAVWFVEEGQIKVFGAAGGMSQVIATPLAYQADLRRAA